MKLMDKNGHATQESLRALAEGSLYEAQRLQLAEHLSCCDECMLAFTMLDEAELPLLQPPRELCTSAVRRLWQRRALGVLQRCGIVAAAACFVFAAWRFDFFAKIGTNLENSNVDVLQQITEELSDSLTSWSVRLSQNLQRNENSDPGVQAGPQE